MFGVSGCRAVSRIRVADEIKNKMKNEKMNNSDSSSVDAADFFYSNCIQQAQLQ
jgi:hypothetical protein